MVTALGATLQIAENQGGLGSQETRQWQGVHPGRVGRERMKQGRENVGKRCMHSHSLHCTLTQRMLA